MKYWLIFMIFADDGTYLDKIETRTDSLEDCYIAAGLQSMDAVNSGLLSQSWCVTDNHYRGVRQDPGIPLD